MTALIMKRAADFEGGASDPRTSSRANLRRGLALSGTLHLLLLTLVLRLTGGGAPPVRTYLIPADLLPPPITEFAPPVVPERTVPPTPHVLDEGVIEPKLEQPSFPIDPISSTGPPRVTDVETASTPPSGREPFPQPGPAGDPPDEPIRVVDELPVPVFAPTPTYPDWAREAGVTGRVLLEALVGRDGRVRQVRIVQGSEGLGEEARKTLLRWIFRPARVNGAPVSTWVAVPVVFRL